MARPHLSFCCPIGYIEKKFYIQLISQKTIALGIPERALVVAQHSEIEWVEQIKGGDKSAEEAVFRRFQDEIRTMVRVRMHRESDENQADTLAKINEGILLSLRKGSFDPDKGKSLGAFIAGVVYNTIAMYFRKKKQERKYFDPGSPDDHPEPAIAAKPLKLMISREQQFRVKACLAQLNTSYATALTLRFHQDLSIGDIADMLDMERRRVSERINYALKLLLKCLQGKT